MLQMRILELTERARVMGAASLFQALPLPVSVGSIRVLKMEKPTCPFTLSLAHRAWAHEERLLAAFQTLAAPKPWIYWFVWVASTVQVPAQAGQIVPDVNANSRNKDLKNPFESIMPVPL